MNKEKHKEWLQGDDKELDYHLMQYQKPKYYTQYICDKLFDWGLANDGIKELDASCGCGAATYACAARYKNIKIVRVDINEKDLNIAKDRALSNIEYYVYPSLSVFPLRN